MDFGKGMAMVGFMPKIRDPLHGTVQLSDLEEKLLDSQPMQRLRGIRQLAMAYLVYPGANHTRFEHSIGTLALTDRICRETGLGEDESAQVRAAALLHDIGHSAFSHEGECVISRFLGNHEQIGEKIIMHGEIADILSENYSSQKIAKLPHTRAGEIISSDIGADRMDYLLRDSHYTGVAYGVIDSEWLCSSLVFSGGRLYLAERGLSSAESLLVARFTMFSTVYLHKTVRIASRMLQQAMSLAMDDGTLAPAAALSLPDAQMLELLESSPSGGAFAQKLRQRHLYKKAYSFPLSSFRGKAEKLESELSDACGCDVLLDVPRLSARTQIKLKLDDGSIAQLSRESELVRSLSRMQKSRLEVLAICEEKNAKKVAEKAAKLIG